MIQQSTAMWLRRLAAGRARCVPLLVFLSILQPLQAAEPADPSIKLREQLRGVMLQLRTAQTETANAQAAAATADAKSNELEAKIVELDKNNATLTKRSITEKTAAEKSIAALQEKLAEREARIVQFTEALEQTKAAYQKADGIAKAKEDQRAKLAAELTAAKLTIADRERKNIALFNVSNEILDRYQNYALGKALSAREPFIGTTRVKVENLVQGYQDKILDNRIAAPSPKPGM